MDKFDIDGLEYNGEPHSRIEKILIDILENVNEDDNTGG